MKASRISLNSDAMFTKQSQYNWSFQIVFIHHNWKENPLQYKQLVKFANLNTREESVSVAPKKKNIHTKKRKRS